MKVTPEQLFDDARNGQRLDITFLDNNTGATVQMYPRSGERPTYKAPITAETAKQLAAQAVEYGMKGALTARPTVRLTADPKYRTQ